MSRKPMPSVELWLDPAKLDWRGPDGVEQIAGLLEEVARQIRDDAMRSDYIRNAAGRPCGGWHCSLHHDPVPQNEAGGPEEWDDPAVFTDAPGAGLN